MKKRKEATVRKNIILRICIFAFVVYAAFILVEKQAEIAMGQQMLETMQNSVEIQRLKNKELARQLENDMDEETIERIARDKLDYVYPDEIVFFDISGS
ncbi:MAG: septum formation initiator family protein [Oscillospiraceae bacterium]|nr:septum formation initiator family protein [Oscillospiraceae bacterium]